jgi:hypothetical protein
MGGVAGCRGALRAAAVIARCCGGALTLLRMAGSARRIVGKRSCVEIWMYVVGMGLAVMMGGALGGSLAKEHGARRVLPIVVPVTLVVGFVVGWALNGWIAYSQESVFH